MESSDDTFDAQTHVRVDDTKRVKQNSEMLPSITNRTYSTSDRPRRNQSTSFKKLPPNLHNGFLRCVEYPNGIFIDKNGIPQPHIQFEDIGNDSSSSDEEEEICVGSERSFPTAADVKSWLKTKITKIEQKGIEKQKEIDTSDDLTVDQKKLYTSALRQETQNKKYDAKVKSDNMLQKIKLYTKKRKRNHRGDESSEDVDLDDEYSLYDQDQDYEPSSSASSSDDSEGEDEYNSEDEEEEEVEDGEEYDSGTTCTSESEKDDAEEYMSPPVRKSKKQKTKRNNNSTTEQHTNDVVHSEPKVGIPHFLNFS